MNLQCRLKICIVLCFGLLMACQHGNHSATSGTSCVANGHIDDVLGKTDCCSGRAIPESTWCSNAEDHGTTWTSCGHVCAEEGIKKPMTGKDLEDSAMLKGRVKR
jgi:hypothetical protein